MKKVLLSYWHYSKGIRSYAFATIALYMAAFLFRDVFRPFAMQHVVDALVPVFGKPGSDYGTVIYYVGMFALVHILSQIFFRTADFKNSKFEARHMNILRNVALEQMIKHSLSFFANSFSGSLVTKQKRYVNAAELIFDELVGQYIYVFVQVIGIVIVLFTISVPIACGVLLWTIGYAYNIKRTAKTRLKLDEIASEMDSKVTGVFADIIGNISIVKMFGRHDHEKERFKAVADEQEAALMASWNFSNRQGVIQGVFSTIIHLGAMFTGVLFCIQGKMTVGEVMLVTLYAGQLSGCLWDFGRSIRRSSRSVADAFEMIEIADQEPELQDYPHANPNPALKPAEASVAFDRVSFHYPNGLKVFQDFNLEIPAGQKVAVIGSTGAGKTTLIQTLLRSLDVQGGSIHIGPYNIKTDVTQDGLKRLVSCVSQNIDLFYLSLAENIAYGRPEATREEVILAAKKARIHDFILTLPEGYETKVGERGVKLSGGQRQRIAIARALLHDTPILVLDEATSSLDNVTEKEIQSILENGLKDKTVLVVAHRLTTIRNCDRIIVLENGEIVQDGNHEALIEDASGIYYRMLNSHEFAVREEIFS